MNSERRLGLRARTDFSISADNGFCARELRAVELSSTGVVLDYKIPPDDLPLVLRLELRLPERHRPILALARPVRCHGRYQAFRFIRLNAADRLTLAEHVDLQARRGAQLN